MALRAHVALDERRRFALALPGGSIAQAFLPVLGAAALPWGSTAFFWVDERAVSADHPESNAGFARLLLAGSPASSVAHWYPVEISESVETSAQAYSQRLVRALGNPPALDVALLGVGDDGHVASLFPGHEPRVGAWVWAERRAPKPPPARVTLTYETLAVASTVCIAALGAGKAEIVRALLYAPSPALPAARVLASAREAWVFVDDDAASLLHGDVRSL